MRRLLCFVLACGCSLFSLDSAHASASNEENPNTKPTVLERVSLELLPIDVRFKNDRIEVSGFDVNRRLITARETVCQGNEKLVNDIDNAIVDLMGQNHWLTSP